MAMQGRMELMARASRQFLTNAKTKPVTNAEMKPTTRGTFSDKPCWTKSGCVRSVCSQYLDVRLKWDELRTGICLYASCDLTSTNLIEEGDILPKDGLQIKLANTLSGHLGSVDPSSHVNVSADKHSQA